MSNGWKTVNFEGDRRGNNGEKRHRHRCVQQCWGLLLRVKTGRFCCLGGEMRELEVEKVGSRLWMDSR